MLRKKSVHLCICKKFIRSLMLFYVCNTCHNVHGQAGSGFEHPVPVEGVPAYSRKFGTR